jgi:hypothetical protein
MAENFNFSTQVGQNWTIPAAYYQGMSQSPTAGSVAAYAGLVRELGGMASDYMENRASENKREASANAALNISKDMYGQAGFDTSAINKYLEAQPNETQSQRIARTEAVVKVLPLWVELMKNKQSAEADSIFEQFAQRRIGAARGSYQQPTQSQSGVNGFPNTGLVPATENEPPLPQGNGGGLNLDPSLFPGGFRGVPYR